jgi:hypothetical protein
LYDFLFFWYTKDKENDLIHVFEIWDSFSTMSQSNRLNSPNSMWLSLINFYIFLYFQISIGEMKWLFCSFFFILFIRHMLDLKHKTLVINKTFSTPNANKTSKTSFSKFLWVLSLKKKQEKIEELWLHHLTKKKNSTTIFSWRSFVVRDNFNRELNKSEYHFVESTRDENKQWDSWWRYEFFSTFFLFLS